MKTVGILWTNSMAGWSAMANSRKKTTVEEQARDKATRAPKRSANLPTDQNQEKVSYWCWTTKTVQASEMHKERSEADLSGQSSMSCRLSLVVLTVQTLDLQAAE